MNPIKKIGLFDSGIGGLSVLKALKKQFPKKDFVYFADTLNLPYGDKSKEELSRYCIKIKDFLLSSGADILVVACNAASCLFLDQASYKNIPLINVISPTVRKLIEISAENSKVGVLATPFTVNSNVYPTAILSIKPDLKIFQKSAPDLALLVEKSWEKPECKEALKANLQPFLEKDIDFLVLGCTHYFFLRDEMKKILPSHIKIVDPLDQLTLPDEKKSDKEKNIFSNVEIYLSKKQPEFIKIAHQIVKNPQITVLNSFY